MGTESELNEAIDELLVRDEATGGCRGRVCVICDRLVAPWEEGNLTVKQLMKCATHFRGDDSLPVGLRACYKFQVEGDRAASAALEKCLLSPRATVKWDARKRHPKVTCCKECKNGCNARALEEGGLPPRAIANHLTIGTAPECLKRLNEVELALLSQARFRGHLFTYWGGCHRSLKGWHSFYDVSVGHTTAVLGAVSRFTQSENIGVVLSGPFTPAQKEQVMKKTQVNSEWVLEAFQWLQENNRLYQDVQVPPVGAPVVIDNSEEVESENTDIERTEEIKVVFPDSTMKTGGADSGAEFDLALAEIRAKCARVTPFLASRPSQQLMRDYEDDNLMRAFPLQFPYGRGPSQEVTPKISETGLLEHLLRLSIPSFHEAPFVLAAHNMWERSKALTGAVWRVMGGRERCDVTEGELNHAIARHCDGLPPERGPAASFLDSVHSVKKNMGHTNADAQANQAKFISLAHHFGCAKALFTLSFDDSLDIRIATLAGVDDIEETLDNLNELSGEESVLKLQELEGVRLKFPGLCALNFEWLLEIVVDRLVGNNESKTGIFGKMEAFALAVEEQGRKTLHAHILVYTTEWNDLLCQLHSTSHRIREEAERKVRDFVDSVMSTQLIPGDRGVQNCPHCPSIPLEFVSEQKMRHLRHKVGCRKEWGVIATCPSCERTMSGDDLCLKRATSSEWWELPPEHVKAKIGLQVLDATRKSAPQELSVQTQGLVNCRFNNHLDRHTKTCFKKSPEGRCRLPDIPEEESSVIKSEAVWELFDWRGRAFDEHCLTVRPRRMPQDAYTNCHCKIISGSKAPCNSNIGITTGARSSIYTSCYCTKNTQKEDSEEFKKMATFAAHRWKETRNDNSLFEGLSRLMGAVMVNTSQHICSGPMASYLVRNGSRFKYSEKFKYVPLREMLNLVHNPSHVDDLPMGILQHDRGCFLSNEAMSYMMRPQTLNDLTALEFFEEYETVRKHDKMKNQAFWDLDMQQHPGFGRQAVRLRKESCLAQFPQWSFPDSSSFGGDIFTLTSPNTSVETYCSAVLVLGHPFRTLSDLTINGSFHEKFIQVYGNGQMPHRLQRILGNIQMFYNSMRLPAKDDPLLSRTQPFKGDTGEGKEENGEEEEDNFFDGVFEFLQCSNSTPMNNADEVGLTAMRKEGGRKCGFSNLPNPEKMAHEDLLHWQINPELPQDFIHTTSAQPMRISPTDHLAAEHQSREKPTIQQLMQLTYRATRRRVDGEAAAGVAADGTALSIIEWSCRSDLTLDEEQQVAFQVATAAFILTYYDEAGVDPQATFPASRLTFIHEKRKLRSLARLQHHVALRMFLDGPGGAGKSRVVNELLKYAQQFTSSLGLKFDMRTIVVTAMSGVAATCIGGETLHKAAGLNRKRDIEDTTWANARLLIIDEVSFMNTRDLENLDQKLRDLMRRNSSIFGGLNVLFCGDFRQLEPCSGDPLYSPKVVNKKWINSINCYVELHGMHRFSDDMEWGHILRRIRDDQHTSHDIDEINKCLLSTVGSHERHLPKDIAYCVYANVDRTAINAGIFSSVLKGHYLRNSTLPLHTLVIKASHMQRITKSRKKVPLPVADRHHIFQHCGDSRVATGSASNKGHFVDPLLKLCQHSPLMLVSNDDVPNGHANGTRVILESVVLNQGVLPHAIKVDGMDCPAVEASDVSHLICSLDGNPMKLFHIEPKELNCRVRAPIPAGIAGHCNASINFRVSMVQFAVLANDATTGHKLQGQTKNNLLISVWSKRKNWNYVALSRVKTRRGLFLASPLPYDTSFAIDPHLRAMMEELRTRSPLPSDLDLQELREQRETLRRHADPERSHP